MLRDKGWGGRTEEAGRKEERTHCKGEEHERKEEESTLEREGGEHLGRRKRALEKEEMRVQRMQGVMRRERMR